MCSSSHAELDAVNAIDYAEQKIVEALSALVEAEELGMDADLLVETLNAQLLEITVAKDFLLAGDSALAIQKALSVIESCNQIILAANSFRDQARITQSRLRMVALTSIPVVAMVAGVLYYYLSKYWQNRRLRTILDMEIKYNDDQ
jgi:hypothetical protein